MDERRQDDQGPAAGPGTGRDAGRAAGAERTVQQKRARPTSSEPGADDVMDKLVYAATNQGRTGLVDKVHHWAGVNGLGGLLVIIHGREP
jgi:hypothetical protein